VGRAFSLAVGSEVYKLRDIQRFCKTKIIPQAIPSLNDVTAIKAEKILDEVKEIIEAGELERMTRIVEKRLLAEDYTSMELAAAFLKMNMGDAYEDIAEEGRTGRDLDELDRWARGGRDSRGGRGGRDGRGRGRGRDRYEELDEYVDRKTAKGGGKVRLFINLGKNQNIKPGDIVGAIAGETGMPGKLIGSIDMYDKYTFVEVPRAQADIVLDAMNRTKIKGKNVHVEVANKR
jgi:ATP-dependent RNA helicase DeaD